MCSQTCCRYLAVWESEDTLCMGHFATQSVVPRPAISASPENLLEVLALGLHLRLPWTGCVLTRSPSDWRAHGSLRNPNLERRCKRTSKEGVWSLWPSVGAFQQTPGEMGDAMTRGGLFCSWRICGADTQREEEKNHLRSFEFEFAVLKTWKMLLGPKTCWWTKWADSQLRGQTVVYSSPEVPPVPSLTHPSTFNVSAWPRKVDGHLRGHVAVFGEISCHSSLESETCSIA